MATPPRLHLTGFGKRDIVHWVAILVMALLPTLGLLAGPSYAPLVFGTAGIGLIGAIAAQRRLPPLDMGVALLALGFAGLCWLSAIWSVNSTQSLRAATQVSLILLASVIVVSLRDWPERLAVTAFNILALAILVGTAPVAIDMATNYKIGFLHLGWETPAQAHKYNRGLNYLILVAWPVLGFLATARRWKELALVVLPLTACIVLGQSGSARAGAVIGLLVFALTWALPRLGARLLAAGLIGVPLSLPLLLRAFADFRSSIAAQLPQSGLHRLEIWDYMSLRILEKPILGWGIMGAKFVPIHPDEISAYVLATELGAHPHNQWIQLWLELGAVGVAFGLALIWLALSRIARLAPPLRPFAYGAMASAVACSFFNYEVTTDSWWAALGVSALLFALLGRLRTPTHSDVS